MKTNELRTKFVKRGYLAALHGKKREDNPCVTYGTRGYAWLRGFAQCLQDYTCQHCGRFSPDDPTFQDGYCGYCWDRAKDEKISRVRAYLEKMQIDVEAEKLSRAKIDEIITQHHLDTESGSY